MNSMGLYSKIVVNGQGGMKTDLQYPLVKPWVPHFKKAIYSDCRATLMAITHKPFVRHKFC